MKIQISLSSTYKSDHEAYGVCRTMIKPILAPASKIPAAIKSLVASYNMRPYDINNGNCDDFALDLLKQVGGEIWETNPMGDDTPEAGQELATHVWLYHSGKHYDAEHPMGVTNWKKFSIFKSEFK